MTQSSTPPISQHMKALDKANVIRLARAEIRAGLRKLPPDESRTALAAILRDPPPVTLDTAPVGKVLTWVRQFGPFRAERMLAALRIPSGRGVGALTARQRSAIAAALDEDAETAAPFESTVDLDPRPGSPVGEPTICYEHGEVLPNRFGLCGWCSRTLHHDVETAAA